MIFLIMNSHVDKKHLLKQKKKKKKKKTSKSLKWPISYIFVILEISGNFLVILGFRGILGYFRDSGVFWPFFDRASWFFFFLVVILRFCSYFGHFKGFMDIYIYIKSFWGLGSTLIILKISGNFGHFRGFVVFFSHFEVSGYFDHFRGFVSIFILLRFQGYFGHFRDFKIFWSF